MTLAEKFATLTPEAQETFTAVKDEAALDTFLSQNGVTLTAEEKKQAVEYVTTGTLALSDDDMDAVAGGYTLKSQQKCTKCGGALPMMCLYAVCPDCR